MTIRLPLFLKSLLICFLAGGVLLNGAELAAQSPDSGTIAGVLVDPSGRAVGGARIIARQKAAGQNAPAIAETQSRDDGSFALTVPPGKYSVTITQDTFAKSNHDLEVVAGQKVEWNLTLEIAPLSASVIVTAQAQPAEASNSTIPVTVVTREEIDQQAAISLPDLLSTLPGFSLARTGPEGGQATLFLDGANSNHAKVLLDGAPMNGSGGFIDYSNMALDNVDKIEVIHGAESAIYGSDAVAGVIQVFTHRGETRTPELTWRATVDRFPRGTARRRSADCSDGSIMTPGHPISQPWDKGRTISSTTAGYRGISATSFRTQTLCALWFGTTPAMPAFRGRHFSFRPISPRTTICTTSLPARFGISRLAHTGTGG